ISPEIKQALAENTPIVALESTIITHGFPHPQNLEIAHQLQQKIRSNGCIPATCAFIKGVPHVGLSPGPIEYLAGQIGVKKISLRDIGPTMALKMNGGTKIAGAIILAHMAGTPVFATGGLAGVHRDEHVTINVSAGLTRLARTPVPVVCSGPKLLV
ncbi:Indigoidine synthase A like protein, partial [Metschnikowia bicuspidata]